MLPERMRSLWRDHPVSVDPNDTNEFGPTGQDCCACGDAAARNEAAAAR